MEEDIEYWIPNYADLSDKEKVEALESIYKFQYHTLRKIDSELDWLVKMQIERKKQSKERGKR